MPSLATKQFFSVSTGELVGKDVPTGFIAGRVASGVSSVDIEMTDGTRQKADIVDSLFFSSFGMSPPRYLYAYAAAGDARALARCQVKWPLRVLPISAC